MSYRPKNFKDKTGMIRLITGVSVALTGADNFKDSLIILDATSADAELKIDVVTNPDLIKELSGEELTVKVSAIGAGKVAKVTLTGIACLDDTNADGIIEFDANLQAYTLSFYEEPAGTLKCVIV